VVEENQRWQCQPITILLGVGLVGLMSTPLEEKTMRGQMPQQQRREGRLSLIHHDCRRGLNCSRWHGKVAEMTSRLGSQYRRWHASSTAFRSRPPILHTLDSKMQQISSST
jgi:hypothetical protein